VKDWLPYLSGLGVIASIVMSAFLAARAAAWRTRDQFHEWERAQQATDAAQNLEMHKIKAQISAGEVRMAVAENRIDSEFSAVNSRMDNEFATVARSQARIEQSLSRLEAFFMRPPANP
jgi:hypothetical protein